MKRLAFLFALGLVAGLVCLPLTATLREKVAAAWGEFKRGYHWGETGYEARGGGPVNSDDSELRLIVPTASEVVIRVEPLP